MSSSSSSSILKGLRIGNYHKMKARVSSSGVESVSEEAPLINSPIGNRRPPADRCYSTYFIFCLLGVGHLLPWNFFITAQTYFQDKFMCHPEFSNGSCSPALKTDFENYFSVAAMLSVCTMTAVNIWLQSKIHYKYRMLFSLIGIMVLFAITVVFVLIDSRKWVNGFFGITILTVIAINAFSAIFQSSTFGFAGVFPSKYTTVVMGGQGIAGILAAVALIFSKLASSNHPQNSALIYFCVAVFIISLCLVVFIIMMRMHFVQHYLQQTSVEVRKKSEAIIEHSTVKAAPPFMKIFLNIFVYALSVFLVFAVTLSLFPAVLSHLRSNSPNPQASGWTDAYFNPLVCFLMFNFSDFCGRFITQWVTFGKNRFVIFSMAVLRIGLIPLFLFCNVGQDLPDSQSLVDVYFRSDFVSVALVALMGFTNGYFGSLSMIAAPMSLPPEQRETAATIMVFFLSSGLLAGSSISFIWTKAILKIT